MTDEQPMVYVKMAVVPVVQRSVQGSVSHTIYNLNPWAMVEEMDVQFMLSYRVKTGCACNGTQKEEQMFATEADILAKKIIPVWAGQYGSPAK